MLLRPFGRSDIQVSALGLGAGQIGDPKLEERPVEQLLNAALDLGINLIDTARGYGLSEERIGKHLAHRRSEMVLSTKVGYGVPDHEDWTYSCVMAGVEMALRLMKTDFLDIVHLHSCPLATLHHNGVIDALERAREQGKLRLVAYSGENEELAWAVESGRFASVECSVNLFDQQSLAAVLPRAGEGGLGVIAKRPLGNAPWRFAERPVGEYCETYWERMQTLAYDRAGLPWDAMALRFSAFAPGVSSAIVGTASLTNLRHNVALVNAGPLPGDAMAIYRARFAEVGADWRGEI
ncbi:MAG: aldo/keto reductase [Betaproteobacteria bacterium]|nr:aldo/keto reductase [Betaproteobacteria bacterium]